MRVTMRKKPVYHAINGYGRETVMHLGRTSTTGGFDVPGEFDLPPEEPVVLVGEIPWELQGDDES